MNKENDNELILGIIKETWLREGGATRTSKQIRLPSKINFVIHNNTVRMTISKVHILENMQNDNNAFEGWALVIKRWTHFTKIILDWDIPIDKDDSNYQRFLFRAFNFTECFKDWFCIGINYREELYEKLKTIGENNLILNAFTTENRIAKTLPEFNWLSEKTLESHITNKLGILHNAFIDFIKPDYLNRQFPVGVFKEIDSNENKILPGGKSAIDIWGIKGKELLIFELKAKSRKKPIGIISELLHYFFVMRSIQQKEILLKCNSDIAISNILNTNKIRAYFLAPSIHPLIDNQLIEIINYSLNMGSFGCINIKDDFTCLLSN